MRLAQQGMYGEDNMVDNMAKYALYMRGGSLGEINAHIEAAKANGIKDIEKGAYHYYRDLGENLEEALATAKRYNHMRSAGDRGYYHVHFKVFPINE